MEQSSGGRLRDLATRFVQEPRIRVVVLVNLFYLGRSIDDQGRVVIGTSTRKALCNFAHDLVRLGFKSAIRANCSKSDPDELFISEAKEEPELDELFALRNQIIWTTERLEKIADGQKTDTSAKIPISRVAGVAIDVAFGLGHDGLEE